MCTKFSLTASTSSINRNSRITDEMRLKCDKILSEVDLLSKHRSCNPPTRPAVIIVPPSRDVDGATSILVYLMGTFDATESGWSPPPVLKEFALRVLTTGNAYHFFDEHNDTEIGPITTLPTWPSRRSRPGVPVWTVAIPYKLTLSGSAKVTRWKGPRTTRETNTLDHCPRKYIINPEDFVRLGNFSDTRVNAFKKRAAGNPTYLRRFLDALERVCTLT